MRAQPRRLCPYCAWTRTHAGACCALRIRTAVPCCRCASLATAPGSPPRLGMARYGDAGSPSCARAPGWGGKATQGKGAGGGIRSHETRTQLAARQVRIWESPTFKWVRTLNEVTACRACRACARVFVVFFVVCSAFHFALRSCSASHHAWARRAMYTLKHSCRWFCLSALALRIPRDPTSACPPHPSHPLHPFVVAP